MHPLVSHLPDSMYNCRTHLTALGVTCEWPCDIAASELAKANPADAKAYLSVCFADAAALFPNMPAGVLRRRFFGWQRNQGLPAGQPSSARTRGTNGHHHHDHPQPNDLDNRPPEWRRKR